jgi:hypothetical protein
MISKGWCAPAIFSIPITRSSGFKALIPPGWDVVSRDARGRRAEITLEPHRVSKSYALALLCLWTRVASVSLWFELKADSVDSPGAVPGTRLHCVVSAIECLRIALIPHVHDFGWR